MFLPTLLVSCLTLSCSFLAASPAITLDKTMPKDIQDSTGISKLTAAQKLALEKWLNENFTWVKAPKEKPSLSENLDGGQKLRLSDGSLYAIAPKDTIRTALWITPFPIDITESGDPEYPCKLTNTNTNSSVFAKQLEPPH